MEYVGLTDRAVFVCRNAGEILWRRHYQQGVINHVRMETSVEATLFFIHNLAMIRGVENPGIRILLL